MPQPPLSSPEVTLAALGIFRGVGAAALAQVARQAQIRRLADAELLFNTGDPSDAMYVLIDGRMRVWTVAASGAEVTLNVLTGGAVFGEIGMLDGSIRTAAASAMAPSQLFSIRRRVFFDTLDSDPQLARNVIDLLCQRLRWVSARMEDASLRQAPQRLARIVGHLARDHGTTVGKAIEVGIKLTQGELAQWTAMSRESLNKTLARWTVEGLLSHARGRLSVFHLQRIDEIAEYGEV
jgi:CRP/FNR family transcriptional regulator, cyclic AMP receptor protein